MIEPIRAQHIENTASSPAFRIMSTEHHPSYPGMDDSPGAHHTRLQRYIENGIGQPVITNRSSRTAQRYHLGMSGGIGISYGTIPPYPQQLSRTDQKRPYRHLALILRAARQIQGSLHPVNVVLDTCHRL